MRCCDTNITHIAGALRSLSVLGPAATLGPALGIASSEISGKVTLLLERFQQLESKIEAKEVGTIELAGTTYEPALSLQFIVVEEVRVLACSC